jgi:hypothetical protein
MANKITKKEMFNMIKEVAGVRENPQMVAFIDHELELLDRKASGKKPTKTQEENKVLKEEVLAVLSDTGLTVTEVQNKSNVLGDLSNQKVSALLRQLVEDGLVVKTIDKKKSFFSLAPSV